MIIRKASFIIFLVLGLLFSLETVGQGLRFQVWTDFNARFQLKDKIQINAEPGYRIEPEIGRQIGYVRVAFRYAPSRVASFDVGVANFNTWGSDTFNSFELRSFQFVFLNWPEVWDFNFKFRVGLEQRWFNFPELETKEFVQRARFRIGLTSPYFDFWEGNSKLFITTNFEILRDVHDESIDALINENRIMLGIVFLDNKNFRGELHYQVNGLRDRAAQEFLRDVNLIRIRAYYYFQKSQ